MLMNWCLSGRYDVNQERVVPVMLMEVSRRVSRMEWLMVSKAALRSRRMRILREPQVVGDFQEGYISAVGRKADPANSSSTTTTKAEEKKTLSKDSILSLYATSSMAGQTQSQHQPAAGQGMYMGQPQMQYATPGFNGGMGGGTGMMPSMAVPNGGYMAMGQGMLPPGAAQGQGMYAMPQQPAQWNMNQMTQQMSTMTTGGGAGAGGAALGAPGAFSQGGAPSPMAGWSAPPASGQTLSTQLWK
ncbi:unnamed protein product [Merluccius merluccius]